MSQQTQPQQQQPKQNVIQLDQMSLEQLDQLKQREEQRLQAYTERFATLRQAAARINASQNAVQTLATATTTTTSTTAGDDDKMEDGDGDDAMDTTATANTKPVFVPLTESVYMPCQIRLDDEQELLIELGTGYYVEKSAAETVHFLDRRLKLVNANSENLTQAIQSTRQNLGQIATAMRGKMLEIQARQQGARNRNTNEEG